MCYSDWHEEKRKLAEELKRSREKADALIGKIKSDTQNKPDADKKPESEKVPA